MKCTHELELEKFWRVRRKRMHKIKILRDVYDIEMNHLGYFDKWYICFKFQGIGWKSSSNLYYSNGVHSKQTMHTLHAVHEHENYFIQNRWNNPNENSGVQLMTIHLLRHTQLFFNVKRKRCNLARIVMYHIRSGKVSFIKSEGSHSSLRLPLLASQWNTTPILNLTTSCISSNWPSRALNMN